MPGWPGHFAQDGQGKEVPALSEGPGGVSGWLPGAGYSFPPPYVCAFRVTLAES